MSRLVTFCCQEVAHLFVLQNSSDVNEMARRKRRWAEWTTEDVEVQPDSWDEPPVKGGQVRDPRDEPFVAYTVNGEDFMAIGMD
jgi:hypothetical protein